MHKLMQIITVTYLVYALIIFQIVDAVGDLNRWATGDDENYAYTAAWYIIQYVGWTEQRYLYDRFDYPLPEYYKVV